MLADPRWKAVSVLWDDAALLQRLAECKRRQAQTNVGLVPAVRPQTVAPGAQ